MKMETVIDPVPTLTAGRFVMRPIRRSDAGLIALHAGDLRVARMTSSIPHPLPPGAIEAYIARVSGAATSEDVWVLDGSEHGLAEVLGVMSLKRLDRDQAEIGYWVAPAFWNTGIASEALKLLLDSNPRKVRTVFGTVFQDNPGSARVLTNAGFDYLGDAETYCVARAAKVPTWTYMRKLG